MTYATLNGTITEEMHRKYMVRRTQADLFMRPFFPEILPQLEL